MTSWLAGKVSRYVLKEHAGNKKGKDDPYFEYTAVVDSYGIPTGKTSKRKKAMPPGLTKREEEVLKKVMRRAYRLDNCFSFCGIRLGWSAIFGLIPGLGDIFDTFMAMMVLNTARKAGIDPMVVGKMTTNIALDFFINLVPILGDLMGVFLKANTRNAVLLYSTLEKRGAARVAAQNPTTNLTQQKLDPALTANQPRPIRNEMRPSEKGHGGNTKTQPKADNDSNSGGGWWGRFGRKNTERDLEKGEGTAPHRPNHSSRPGGGK